MNDNPWEEIYRRDGHVFTDIRPAVVAFADNVVGAGARTLLDVGCGNGRHLVYFAQRGLRVTGLDSAPTALGLAREWLGRVHLTANLLLADAHIQFPLADSSFDAILTTQVIHHALLSKVRGTIAEMRRVLRPGGWLLLSVPVYRQRVEGDEFHLSDEVEYHTFVPLDGPEAGLPHHLFTEEELQGEFEGFEIHALAEHGGVVLVLVAQKCL